ncbi:MAG: hypothetical protein ACRD2C_04675 [Acidimicrobiales bacterium]
MGDPRASAANIDFEYDLALSAARDLSSLASVVNDKSYAWQTEAGKALNVAGDTPWEGGKSDHFNSNLSTATTDGETISSHLGHLATTFAEQWARARGEQDRINHARWAQAQRDDDGWFENNVTELVYDEDTGPPPEDPDPPSASNNWEPTREPIHPEYEDSVSV